MKRLLSAILSLLFVAGLSACGQEEAAEAPAQTTPPPVEQPASQLAPAAAPAQVTEPASSAEGDAQAPTPAAQVSETDDPLEQTAVTPDSGTQPNLRLAAATEPPPPSGQFKEGIHYKRVVPAQPTNAPAGQIEVVEVFWYGCPHCYHLDPLVESWRNKTKPAFVQFRRVPAVWSNVHKLHARVFYTAELLGKLDDLHVKAFRAIHAEANMLDTPEKIQAFFVANGVSEADFKRTFSSFAVENKLRQAEVFGRAYRIDAVPMFTINGKFVTGAGDAGGETQLFALLNEVATAEHGGR